jgi:hypothetical protein
MSNRRFEMYEYRQVLVRMRHGAYRVVLDGESFRSPRPLPEAPKSALVKGPKTAKS